MKRKRTKSISSPPASWKRSKLDRPNNAANRSSNDRTHQPYLNHVYAQVRTLKEYLLQALPRTSRMRRRQLQSIEQDNTQLHAFLTTTLVCGSADQPLNLQYDWEKDFNHFTQTQRATQSHTASTQHCSMNEVIEFVIGVLFGRCVGQVKRPNHILCQGFERSVTTSIDDAEHLESYLPGILKRRDNASIEAFLSPIWQDILRLLGRNGQTRMINLLLEKAIFVSIEKDSGNYAQLSGVPVYEMMAEKKLPMVPTQPGTRPHRKPTLPLDSITLARSRILYGKPSFNNTGNVHFGLRSSHILQRLANVDSTKQSTTLIRYIFPKQFGLRNAFTPETNQKNATHFRKDYIYRENEPAWDVQKSIPRRLRRGPLQLTQKMIQYYNRCSFHQLISRYCPLPTGKAGSLAHVSQISTLSASILRQSGTGFRTQINSNSSQTFVNEWKDDGIEDECVSFLPYATHPSQVANFGRTCLQHILPHNTFGDGPNSQWNWRVLFENVHMLICMRRFETASLHQLVQKLRLKSVPWLTPNSVRSGANMALSDKNKREELLYELVYFIFDSLLIPIISSNFYVTETGIHRNKLLFFRHDVWHRLCQPCLQSTKLNGFTLTSGRNINNVTSTQKLGHSHLRLLPKDVGTRSIINLKRRILDFANGKPFLRRSINEQLTPVFNIFNFERHGDTGVFKSDSLSSRDLLTKLLRFKAQIGHSSEQPLYFIKVDIQSAFDSIPQAKLLDLIKHIFKHSEYSIVSHNEGRRFGPCTDLTASSKFIKTAVPFGSKPLLAGSSEDRSTKRKNTVYSNTDRSYQIMKDDAIRLLEEHIHNNTIKIDSKYYRQSSGIAQGSVLSSLLCTFFYNDFERKRLKFLSSTSSILLRIIDDFLLITACRDDAAQFVKAMAEGDTNYGIRIHPEKSLANFDVSVNGAQLSKTPGNTAFPFCGLLIDTKTLQVSKDRVRKDNVVANALTVDLHGRAGQKLRRRLEASMRIQLQGILLDPLLNDRMRIMRTLVECFQETAMKMYRYYKHLPRNKRPSQKTLIELIRQLINFVTNMLGQRRDQPRMMLGQPQISSLAAAAMIRVLTPKRSQHGLVIEWLCRLKKQFEHSLNLGSKSLEDLSDACFESLQHYKY